MAGTETNYTFLFVTSPLTRVHASKLSRKSRLGLHLLSLSIPIITSVFPQEQFAILCKSLSLASPIIPTANLDAEQSHYSRPAVPTQPHCKVPDTPTTLPRAIPANFFFFSPNLLPEFRWPRRSNDPWQHRQRGPNRGNPT